MSIGVYFIEGLSCPFFMCDVCGERIAEPGRTLKARPLAGYGMCAWGQVIEDDVSFLRVGHYHKGICLDTAEARLPKGHRLMTQELVEHLKMMVENTFLKPPQRGETQASAPHGAIIAGI